MKIPVVEKLLRLEPPARYLPDRAVVQLFGQAPAGLAFHVGHPAHQRCAVRRQPGDRQHPRPLYGAEQYGADAQGGEHTRPEQDGCPRLVIGVAGRDARRQVDSDGGRGDRHADYGNAAGPWRSSG